MYKMPNSTMRNHRDWSQADIERFSRDQLPITSYKPAGDRERYDRDYTHWDVTDENGVTQRVPARNYYRVAWRSMAANTGERTLIPALIPPGPAQISQSVYSAGFSETNSLMLATSMMSSLICDFAVRAVPKSAIIFSTVLRLPTVSVPEVHKMLFIRTLRLNCLTDAYADLWQDCYTDDMQSDSWAGGFEHNRRKPLGDVGPEWTPDTPLRIAADRRQALVEIDALVALGLGLTADELCTIYRTQFPVLYGYDKNKYLYDVDGRLVPQEVLTVWRKKGDAITEDERTATNPSGNTYTYELPFRFLGREADMREAYAEFERRLAEEN